MKNKWNKWERGRERERKLQVEIAAVIFHLKSFNPRRRCPMPQKTIYEQLRPRVLLLLHSCVHTRNALHMRCQLLVQASNSEISFSVADFIFFRFLLHFSMKTNSRLTCPLLDVRFRGVSFLSTIFCSRVWGSSFLDNNKIAKINIKSPKTKWWQQSSITIIVGAVTKSGRGDLFVRLKWN